MPPKEKAVAADVRIKSCQAMRQFSGGLVVYLQLDRRLPDGVLEILRGFGFYRKGPGGAGWHITLEQAPSCAKAIKPIWLELAQRISRCAREMEADPRHVDIMVESMNLTGAK